MNNNLKQLFKLAGILFISIGLLFSIIMLALRWLPSLLFIVIMVTGGVIYYLNRDAKLSTLLAQDGTPIDTNGGNPLVKKAFLLTAIMGICIFLLLIGGFVITRGYMKEKSTEAEIKLIAASISNYKGNIGSYPEDLGNVISNSPLKKDWYTDSWGNPYKYSKTATGYELISAGRDGSFDTMDDLKYKF